MALGGCLFPHVLQLDQDPMVLISSHLWAENLPLTFSLLQKENLGLVEVHFYILAFKLKKPLVEHFSRSIICVLIFLFLLFHKFNISHHKTPCVDMLS